MDEFRKRLEENADEAEFALLIDDYLNDLGESLQNKYEEAKQRGEAPEMPEDMKNRLRQFIATYNDPIETSAESAESTLYDTPAKSQSARLSTKWLRRLGVAAATIAILVGSMLTVQATGIDVFGAIARWTDSSFYYERTTSTTDIGVQENNFIAQLKHAVLSQGLPGAYAPAWLPERFILSELKSESNELFSTIQAMFYSPANENLIIEITDAKAGDYVWNEKIGGDVEVINTNEFGETAFRIFQNSGNWTAVWSNGLQSISIYGNVEFHELKKIINTMGVN